MLREGGQMLLDQPNEMHQLPLSWLIQKIATAAAAAASKTTKKSVVSIVEGIAFLIAAGAVRKFFKPFLPDIIISF